MSQKIQTPTQPAMKFSFQWLAIGILLVAVSILYALRFTDTQKTVYVDSNKLVNGFKGMQEAKKVYQQKATQWKANVDTLTSELQGSIMKYEKEVGKMTAKEKALTQELLRSKQKQLGEFQQAMTTKAQQEDGQMTTQVITQINAYLKKYGKKKGYRIIFAATDYGNIAYAEDDMDITEEVLEGLNAEYQGK
ncbi:MAG: OmpH family outer membrane protein [Cyclobacteriaceae bacterium]